MFCWIRRVGVLGVLVAGLFGASACGDSDRQGAAKDADGATDAADTGDVQGDSAGPDGGQNDALQDSSVAPDIGDTGEGDVGNDVFVPQCTTNPGGLLCPCDSNADCNSEYCIPSRQGDQVCTVVCDVSCPAGLVCKLVSFPGQDQTYLCIDEGANLCRPCRKNSDCQGNFGSVGDRCVAHGDAVGAFCGLGCGAQEPCPGGYACTEVADVESGATSKQCVPEGGGECACSARAVIEQASTGCANGACEGSRVCTAEGLGACDAQAATTEVCDGLDNNCNGATDEGFANTDGDFYADCVDPDDDNDFVDDGLDNCPLAANPAQEDGDEDGIGDVCDTPGAPSVQGTTPGSPANDNAPVLGGRGEPGTTVRVYLGTTCGGVPVAEALVDAEGRWAATMAVVDNSTTAWSVNALDPNSGLPSECGATTALYVEDSSAPLTPTLAGTTPGSPGPSLAFTIHGSAEPGSTVTLFSDASCLVPTGLTATAASDGAFTAGAVVAAGASATFRANARDAAGNVSACSGPLVYQHDAEPPAPPVLTTTIPASPSDSVTQPILVGSAEAGATVDLYTTADCSGAPAKSVNVANNGIFTLTVTVPANSATTFHATATDAAGNVSACSPEGITFIHDDEAPAPPVLVGTTPASPGGSTTPIVFGTSEPAASVRIYLGAGCSGFQLGEATADASGAFTLTVLVTPNVETHLYGRATDLAGRVSPCTTDPLIYRHDGQGPAQLTFTGTTPASPSPNPTPLVSGHAEAGATVALFFDAACTQATGASGPVDAAGAFALPVSVPPNAATVLHGLVTDDAGNLSACSLDTVTYVHDDDAPDAPLLSGTSPASPSSSLTPHVTGQAEPASTVAIFDEASCGDLPLGEADASADGTFSVPVSVATNTTTTFYANATDAAGNVSSCSLTPIAYSHDDSQPLVPTLLTSDPTSPSRVSTTPNLVGVAEAGAIVNIHKNAACSDAPAATTTASAGGQFLVGVVVAPNSTTTFYARAVDSAGNPSPCSPQGLVYVHDNLPPAPPALTGAAPASPSNQTTTPTLSGHTTANGQVSLFTGAGCTAGWVATVTAGATGEFSVQVTVTANTATTFYASAVDAAGNVSTCTPSGLTWVHDNTPPTPPTLLSTDPPSPATTTTPKVNGSAEATAHVTLYTDALCTGSVAGQGAASAAGTFQLTALVGANQTSQLRARATDAAGNVSSCSPPLAYVNDSLAPTTPVWTGSVPPSPTAASTTVTASGTTDPAVTVRLYLGVPCTGAPVATGVSASDGQFSFTRTVTANSITRLFANAVDAVGNVSGCTSPELVFVHDTQPPAKPSLTGTTPATPGQDATPDVRGTAEAGSVVRLFATADCSGAVLGTATAASNLAFTVTGAGPVADNATTTLYANATDAVGNVSACSDGRVYVHDTVAPAKPVLLATDPPPPSKTSNPLVLGTAEPLSQVQIFASPTCAGGARGTGAVTALGTFSVAALADSNTTTTFYARATDAAGNVGLCSDSSVAYLHDSAAPLRPHMVSVTPVKWSNTISDPVVTGTAEPNSVVTIYGTTNCAGGVLKTVAADAAGLFSAAVEIGPSDRQVYFAARATDVSGNTSACSDNFIDYRFDKTPPTFGGVTTMVAAGDGTTQVRVGWSAASDNLTTAANMVYVICLSTRCGAIDCDFGDPTSPLLRTTTPGLTTWTLTGLAPNTRYYAVVRARDEVGNQDANTGIRSFKTLGRNAGVLLTVGENTACLGLADGNDVCWGPDPVPPLVVDPVQLAFGPAHSCAVLRSGTIRCWGSNSNGQLGNGTKVSSTASVAVSNITTGAKVSVGLNHSCALLTDGRVLCWGRDEQAQLGNGFTITGDQLTPVAVTTNFDGTAPFTNAVDLSCGRDHSCALRDDGTLWCWGANGYGQLGTGDNQDYGYAVPSLAEGVVQVAAGQSHTCAATVDGQVLCWGWNLWGQLGNGTWPSNRNTPQDTGLDGVIGIRSSLLHTCAVQANGSAACWGQNTSGQTGKGVVTDHVDTPTEVPLASVVEIGGGDAYSCARLSDGRALCWGSGTGGRLGQGTSTASSLVPLEVVVPLGVSAVTDVALRHEHTCVALSDGTARCWGRNTDGQLGNGESGVDAAPLAVVQTLGGVIEVATGSRHSCARTSSGLLACWGANDRGQLARTGVSEASSPGFITDVADVRAVAVGYDFTCAVQVDGVASCWGDNVQGQLGRGQLSPGFDAAPDAIGVANVVGVAAGVAHACAWTNAGEAYCWGDNASGQVTGTPSADVPAPTLIASVTGVRAMAAGGGHTCALRSNGRLTCWGDNAFGQLGRGVTGGGTTPVEITTLVGVRAVTAGTRHSCAIRFNGESLCWGDNASGEVGAGLGTALFNAPRATVGVGITGAIAGGEDNTCAVDASGNAWCWGDNDATALGTGQAATVNATSAQRVQCLP